MALWHSVRDYCSRIYLRFPRPSCPLAGMRCLRYTRDTRAQLYLYNSRVCEVFIWRCLYGVCVYVTIVCTLWWSVWPEAVCIGQIIIEMTALTELTDTKKRYSLGSAVRCASKLISVFDWVVYHAAVRLTASVRSDRIGADAIFVCVLDANERCVNRPHTTATPESL